MTEAPFGMLPDGSAVTVYTLTNRHGLRVNISNFGGVVTELHTPDRHGQFADIVLGFDSLPPYLD